MITANIPHTKFTFPVGEMQVNIDTGRLTKFLNVTFVFERNDEIVELMLLVDAATRAGILLGTLTVPYVPFSRQDRINTPGESFSLSVFAKLINSLDFEYVVIHDPHSDVTPALLNGRVVVVSQAELILPLMTQHVKDNYWLVSPDAGATKKIHHLAKLIRQLDNNSMICRNFQGVIEASKQRNTLTGEITGTFVPDWGTELGRNADDIYCIVDDICDGGRTFIELAKALRAKGCEKIHLYVTHGFFTKGGRVFDGLIDQIHVVHPFQREKQ